MNDEIRGWDGLPQMSQYMYKDTYFLPDEDYEGWVNRICYSYSNDSAHGERLKTYLKNYWWHPSTPVSANGGTDRGLPISCFVGDVQDSKEGIFDSWTESSWLGAMGGGVGRVWSEVREMGASVGTSGGKSSGIIPFMCVDGSLTRAISQGGLRRFSQADYLHISHPEIVEFLDIRKPTGDQNRRDQDLHHGVVVSDAFMKAVINNADWNLISPKTNLTVETVKARDLWTHILEQRVTTGEPYIMFEDTVNSLKPKEYVQEDLSIKLSNLCTEIFLHTSDVKTNVCCLASLNLEYFDEYKDNLNKVIADLTDFLDNVLEDFIQRASKMPGFEKAVNAAKDERAIGLGVMGFHSYLQRKGIPFESAIAKGTNLNIFNGIRDASDMHQLSLMKMSNTGKRCPMSVRCDTNRRNIVTLAIAPTMSISNLCNLASSGVEPWISNAFSKKLKQGTFAIKNKYLQDVINDYALEYSLSNTWIEEQWNSIKKFEGSVQHLDWLDPYWKDVFKTAFEIDQRWLIEHAGDRAPLIDQGQSINIFIPGNSHVQYISDLHILAWKRKVKSLYYLRSTNPNRAVTSSNDRKTISTLGEMMEDTCLACT